VSFGFGLLHGFGFANVLHELGLGRAGLATALFAFNAGVEVGQLAIVLVAVPALWALGRTRFQRTFATAASALILSLGVWWLWERVV
jgi:hypothetical protein